MDMSYATIPMIWGSKILYKKKIYLYVVSSQGNTDDHAIYIVDIDLGSSILFNDVSLCNLEISTPIKEEG